MHSMLGRYERVVRTILLGRTVNRGPLSTFSGSVILLPYATNQNFKYICGYKLLKFSKEIIQVFKLYIFNIFLHTELFVDHKHLAFSIRAFFNKKF